MDGKKIEDLIEKLRVSYRTFSWPADAELFNEAADEMSALFNAVLSLRMSLKGVAAEVQRSIDVWRLEDERPLGIRVTASQARAFGLARHPGQLLKPSTPHYFVFADHCEVCHVAEVDIQDGRASMECSGTQQIPAKPAEVTADKIREAMTVLDQSNQNYSALSQRQAKAIAESIGQRKREWMGGEDAAPDEPCQHNGPVDLNGDCYECGEKP